VFSNEKNFIEEDFNGYVDTVRKEFESRGGSLHSKLRYVLGLDWNVRIIDFVFL
jgi:hypothetical protein